MFGVFGRDLYSWRFLLACPLLIAALFGISVGTIEVNGSVVRYRRFLRWTTVRHDEIVSAGALLAPLVGYLRLNRFVFPWSRVYFALDENLNANPFGRGEFALLNSIKKGLDVKKSKKSLSANSNELSDRSLKLRLLIAGFAGVLFSIFLHIFATPSPAHQSVLEHPFPANQPALLAMTTKVYETLFSFPVILIPFSIFVIVATFRRRRQDGLAAAFMAGSLLPNIILHWL
jgi:hypothetical protein